MGGNEILPVIFSQNAKAKAFFKKRLYQMRTIDTVKTDLYGKK